MKRSIVLALTLGISCSVPSLAADCHVSPEVIRWPLELPHYDHVVIVVEENRGIEQIFPKGRLSPSTYLERLRHEGATLGNLFAEEHHSQGNYFWLLSGSDQKVGFLDCVPKPRTISAENLAHLLGESDFRGYSEDLPRIGSTDKFAKFNAYHKHLYARKHVPWISFHNLPYGNTVQDSANLTFAEFPQDPEGYAKLPHVSFVIPNQDHDMHNDKSLQGVGDGGAWLEEHLDGYYQWARTHNSLLIVTFDENSHEGVLGGLTDPAAKEPEDRNQIATIFAGEHVKPGFVEEQRVTHVNILRTLESMYGLPRSGAQQEKACAAGILDDVILTGLFEPKV